MPHSLSEGTGRTCNIKNRCKPTPPMYMCTVWTAYMIQSKDSGFYFFPILLGSPGKFPLSMRSVQFLWQEISVHAFQYVCHGFTQWRCKYRESLWNEQTFRELFLWRNKKVHHTSLFGVLYESIFSLHRKTFSNAEKKDMECTPRK